MKTLAAAVLAVLLLSLGACGGSGGSSSPNDDKATAAKSIADSLVKSKDSTDSTSQLLSVNRTDADCIGKGLVDRVGTDQLQKYGLLTKKLKANDNISEVKMSAKDAAAAADVTTGCTDIKGRVVKTIESLAPSLPASAKACIDKALGKDVLRRALTSAFQGKSEATQRALTGPLMACTNPQQ